MRYCPRCGENTEERACPEHGIPTVRRAAPVEGELPEGQIIGGRYRVVGVIGRGGFGTVYETSHMTTGHAVAVKVLTQRAGSAGEEAARRFFQEAATTSRLSHPNTVRVFDFGQIDAGNLFLTMERLVGESLQDMLDRLVREERTVSEMHTVDIGIAVLRSLGEAHAHGLVHRDLKPANIFLHQVAGGDSIVKVLDFGIVKNTNTSMTQAGKALGTPTHMSPEQAMGKPIDARSDLYALGVVLYECLTGTLPFAGDNPLAVVMQHVTEPCEPVLVRAPDVARPAVAAVIERSLEKLPERRWANAAAMRVALQEALGQQPSGVFPITGHSARAGGASDDYTTRGNVERHRPAAPMSVRDDGVASPPLTALESQETMIAAAYNALEARVSEPRLRQRSRRPPSAPLASALRRAPPVDDSEPSRLVKVNLPGVSNRERRPSSPTRLVDIPAPPPPSGTSAFAERASHNLEAVRKPAERRPAPSDLEQEFRQDTTAVAVLAMESPTRPEPLPVRPATSPPADDVPIDSGAIAIIDAHDLEEVEGEAPVEDVEVVKVAEAVVEVAKVEVAEVAEVAEVVEAVEVEVVEEEEEDEDVEAEEVSSAPKPPASRRPRRSQPSQSPPPSPSPSPLAGISRNPFAAMREQLESNVVGGLAKGGSRGAQMSLSQGLQALTRQLERRSRNRMAPSANTVSAMWMGADATNVLYGDNVGDVRMVHFSEIVELPTRVLEARETVDVGNHASLICAVAADPEGRLVASACVDGWLRLWDPADGTMIAEQRLQARAVSLAISTDGRLLVAGADDGSAHLLRLPGFELRRSLRGHSGAVNAVAATGSLRLLATAGEDGTVRTWDPAGGGARLTSRAHDGAVASVTLSRNARWVISGGWDGRVLVWSSRDGETHHDIDAHSDIVAGVAISPDDAFIATASDDRSVKIWSMETGNLVAERDDFDTGAKFLHFSADSRCVYIGAWDGSCRRLSAVGPL